jgi:glycosyltransferase involved in cell wall biosynthesis
MTMEKLKIAQVAPLYESIPPKLYGGTERVVSYLTEALVNQGHEVTLFASGDSITDAKLISVCKKALRLDENCVDQLAPHIIALQLVQDSIDQFDIVHYHNDYLHFPLSNLSNVPHVTTLHGRLNITELQPLYNVFNKIPLVSISDSQRQPIPQANWIGTVYHGLPENLYTPTYTKGNYLAFLGRISPEKRVDRAIEIAIRCGIPLKISAKIDKSDSAYYKEVEKLFDHPLIEFIGETGESEKNKFLSEAMALLFPIDWPEPFGLVMIEALACGTPVIAFNHGSVSEVITDGQSGFIVTNIDEAVEAVSKLNRISRVDCRRTFEERFTASKMAEGYVNIYKNLIANQHQLFKQKEMQT